MIQREDMGGEEKGPGSLAPSPLLSERSISSTSASGSSSSAPAGLVAPTHARARRRAAAAAAATISVATRRKSRGAVCQACRRIRTTCEGGYPCSRCWRLALPCRPQTPSTPSKAGAQIRRRPEQPLLELAFAHCTPRAHAELFAQAFMALHAEGRAIRERALYAIRAYQELSHLFGVDPTWGFTNVLARAFDCSPMDITASDELLLDPPMQQREAALRARVERKERAAAALRAEPFFQDLVAQNPNAAVHMSVITPEDGLVEATNDLHDALFWPIQEMYEDSIRHKTISPLLAASLVDPDDRKTYLEAIAWACFAHNPGGPPERLSHILKVFDRQGEMHLVHFSMYPGRPLPPAMFPSAIIITLERLPPSRHLSLVPGHRDVVHRFKSTAGVATAALPPSPIHPGDAARAPIALLPGIACIPTAAPMDMARAQAAAMVTPPPPQAGLMPPAAAAAGHAPPLDPALVHYHMGWDGGLAEDAELLEGLLQDEDEGEGAGGGGTRWV